MYSVHITAQALVVLALAAPLDTMIGLPLYKADFQNVKAKSLRESIHTFFLYKLHE